MRALLGIFAKKIYRNCFFPFKKLYLSIFKNIEYDIGAYSDRKTVFEGHNALGMDVFLAEAFVGYGSYIADFSKLFSVNIGKYVSIGQNVITAIGKHPVSENISTCPSFYSLNPKNQLRYVTESTFCETNTDIYSINIGNDVWIGNNVTILAGVHIGDGAVIGAGAVVIKDVEPYAVYVGNPARRVKYRFSNNEIEKLMTLKWWNKDTTWIKAHAQEFSEPYRFLKE